jgi:hypothetical protein
MFGVGQKSPVDKGQVDVVGLETDQANAPADRAAAFFIDIRDVFATDDLDRVGRCLGNQASEFQDNIQELRFDMLKVSLDECGRKHVSHYRIGCFLFVEAKLQQTKKTSNLLEVNSL